MCGDVIPIDNGDQSRDDRTESGNCRYRRHIQFIMDGVDVVNKCIATTPLIINLPDGKKVKSTHVCDIIIPGLPTVLLGHIVPSLTVASLIGIRPLCKAGCTVVFDDKN